MRKTLRIARQELNYFFYSPIAWLLLIAFMVQCAVSFTDSVQFYMLSQNMRKLYQMAPPHLTTDIMVKALFKPLADKLYLYLPLLTMGLVSREVSSGTIRLLYSSPLRTSQIVLGKFMAMMVYNLLLLLILGIAVGISTWVIPHADMGMMLSGLLGFYLLMCAYAAIGLFMSCLTSYQVVAALSTLAVFAALQYLAQVGQGNDFVRDLTYYMSLASRMDNFFVGMITTRDLLYFIDIIFLFLGFSLIRLQSDRESKPTWRKVLQYAGSTVIAFGLGYLTSRPALTGYWDTTAPKANTLAASTKAMLRSMGPEPLEITAYVNLLDFNYQMCSPQARQNYLKVWEQYGRYTPIRFRYEYYYDTTAYTARMLSGSFKGQTIRQVAEQFAQSANANLSNFKTPEQMRHVPGLAGENGRLVLQLRYKGRTRFVRTHNDPQFWPAEDEVVSALKALSWNGPLPKIAFLQGGYERDPYRNTDRAYQLLATDRLPRFSLINHGYETDTIGEGRAIPSDLAVLVVADPKTAFSPATMDRLRRYIAGGGDLLLTSEPDKAAMINPLLDSLGLGVRLKDGVLVCDDRNDVPDLVKPLVTPTGADMSQGAAGLFYSHRPVYMQTATAIGNVSGTGAFDIRPLLVMNRQDSWLKKGRVVNDSAAVSYNAAEGDEQGSLAPAVSLERKINGRDQRIVVTGDADFMDNQQLKLRYTNPPFCVALFKWFSGEEFPVEVDRLENKDLNLGISPAQHFNLKIVYIWVLPALLLVGGAVLLIRRKRK